MRERNLERLDEATAACGAALADTGAIAVREDTNLEPAFWGQFPGNEAYLVRRALISSANMAILKPSPSSPTRFSTGTSTSWSEKPPVLPARIPVRSWRDTQESGDSMPPRPAKWSTRCWPTRR